MFKLSILLILINNFFSVAIAREISNLIEPISYFSGRTAELDDLRHNLANYKKASIVGISGIGKSQLIRKFSQNKSYKIVWFFDCNRDLDAQYLELAKHINKSIEDKNFYINEDYASVKESVLNYLKPKKDWLLVYDNLRLGRNHLIKDIIDLEANGDIIIASQDGSNLPYITYLQPIAEKESIEIINKILPSNKDADYLNNIFKGYPLLLARGAMLIKNSFYTSKDYKKLLSEQDLSIKTYMNLLISNLSSTEKDLMYRIAIINNQNFSRNFLEKITDNKDQFVKDLDHLIHLGLISKIKDSQDDVIFEMHDAIKEQIIASTGTRLIKNTIINLINKINKIVPTSPNDKYLFFTKDSTLIPSLEILFTNAELYKINKTKILNVRGQLIILYIHQRNYTKCEEMAQWLYNYKKNNYWQLWLMSEEDKTIYASYLNYSSLYEDWFNQNFDLSIRLKDEAKDIIMKLKDNEEYKFQIFVQITQAYMNTNNIKKVNKNLILLEKFAKTDYQREMIWFIKARIFVAQGEFTEALNTINKILEMNKDFNISDSFLFPVFVLKAKILNHLNDHQRAFEILNNIYLLEKDKKPYSEILVNTLTYLSQAVLGMGKIDAAYEYILKAKNISLEQRKKNISILSAQNIYLAQILKAEADCLAALGNHHQAITNYVQAEAIYYNLYRGNMKNNVLISSLYSNAANAACKLKDKFWFNKFKREHFSKFGINHPKSMEIQAMHCF